VNIEQLVHSGSGGVFQFTAGAALPFPEVMPRQSVDTLTVSDKASFLRETATAMRFPDYFGQNWDAFYDCLCDLGVQGGQGLALVFSDLSRFASNQPDEFEKAIGAMDDAVSYWKGVDTRLLILIGLNDPRLATSLSQISPG